MSEQESPKIDLSACAQEPIHIPEKIQPFGALIAFSLPDLRTVRVSANLKQILGVSAQEVLGKKLEEWLGEPQAVTLILARLKSARIGLENPTQLQLQTTSGVTRFNLVFNRAKDFVLMEIEPAPVQGVKVQDQNSFNFSAVYQNIQSGISSIQKASSLEELQECTVHWVQELTGYDRVMIYQFDRNWNGKVIAEAKTPDLESFLGLQYPASDIPAQARALYEINPIRIIPEVVYQPVSILSLRGHKDQVVEPLDLSHSVLRSVSPVHVQYLKNMNVGASLSISIMKAGKLWGLIACHHQSARPLTFEIRQGLEFIASFYSLQLTSRENVERKDYKETLKKIHGQLFSQMKKAPEFLSGLIEGNSTLLNLSEGISGAAIAYRDEIMTIGETPSRESLVELVKWLRTSVGAAPVFETDTLSLHFPLAQEFKSIASGLLSISIPEPRIGYVLWFKPEVIQTVKWAGNPEKPAEKNDFGLSLSPRRSFEIWKETVQNTAIPWAPEEVEAAENLRQSIIEIDLERQVVTVLRSNDELDQFAQIVAHDLKEPLRGIYTFAEFIKQDMKGRFDSESSENIQAIIDLAQRSRALLNDLYQYSKLGKVGLTFEEIDTQRTLEQSLVLLKRLIEEKSVEIRIPKKLPVWFCDEVRLREIFFNLIGNALKYNRSESKWVEIGFSSEKQAFYVKDNGIGIASRNYERVFKLFQRLHAPEEFDGGTGAGLAIVRRMVELHGGRVWIESALDVGTTFWFTLSPLESESSN